MNEKKNDYDLSNFNRFINLTEDIIINCEFYYKRAEFDIINFHNKLLNIFIKGNHLSFNELRNIKLIKRSKAEIEKRYNNVNTNQNSFINYVISQIEKSINEIDNLADKYNLYHDEILPSVWYIFELRQLNVILKEWIETELLIIQKSKDKKEIINRTFESKLTPEQIKKLHIALKEKNYIPSTTSLRAFRMIFTGEPIQNIKEPVKWLKNKPKLLYLLYKLIYKECLNPPQCLYKTIENCFINSDGNKIVNLKQSNNSVNNRKKVFTDDIIDEIIKSL